MRLLERMSVPLLLIVCLAVGAISGVLVRAIVGRSTRWFVASALFGFVGGLLGTATGRLSRLADLFDFDVAGHPVDLVWPCSQGRYSLVLWCVAGQVLISSFPAHRRVAAAPVARADPAQGLDVGSASCVVRADAHARCSSTPPPEPFNLLMLQQGSRKHSPAGWRSGDARGGSARSLRPRTPAHPGTP